MLDLLKMRKAVEDTLYARHKRATSRTTARMDEALSELRRENHKSRDARIGSGAGYSSAPSSIVTPWPRSTSSKPHDLAIAAIVSTRGMLPLLMEVERNEGLRPISFDTVRWLFPASAHILSIACFTFMTAPFAYGNSLSEGRTKVMRILWKCRTIVRHFPIVCHTLVMHSHPPTPERSPQ